MQELYDDERNLIEIIRSFNFLREYGYCEKELSIGHREYPTIIYVNPRSKMKVSILGTENSWSIIVERWRPVSLRRGSFAFDVSDFFNVFNSSMIKGRKYSLKAQAEFIQHHLMPVIKGEMWIHELIKECKK
jgi:hypothetical protein